MSAFCVYGMTEPVARRLAERQFDTYWAKLTNAQRDAMTLERSKQWVEDRTIEILDSDRVQQVSPPLRRASILPGMDRSGAPNGQGPALRNHGPRREAGRKRRGRHQQGHQTAGHGLARI